MTEWRVQLQGNSRDLQEIKEILSTHDPTIIQEGSDFYLKSKDWDQFHEAEQVRNAALQLIGLLDSAAYIHFRDSAPLSIGHIMRIDDDGQRQRFVFGEVHLIRRTIVRASATVTGPDGQLIEEQKQEHSIIRTLRTSTKHTYVADALRFFRKGDWGSLYKAFEIVRDEVRGEQEIIKRKWLTKKSISRFTQTVQSRDFLGDDARHASRKYKLPKEPMSIHEAKAIIADLIQRWIDSM